MFFTLTGKNANEIRDPAQKRLQFHPLDPPVKSTLVIEANLRNRRYRNVLGPRRRLIRLTGTAHLRSPRGRIPLPPSSSRIASQTTGLQSCVRSMKQSIGKSLMHLLLGQRYRLGKILQRYAQGRPVGQSSMNFRR